MPWTETIEAFLSSEAPLHLLLILQFRLLPFVGYALYHARSRPFAALVTSGLAVALLLGLTALPVPFGSQLLMVCVGLAYSVAISVSVPLFASSPESLGG